MEHPEIIPDVSIDLLDHLDEDDDVHVAAPMMALFMDRIYLEGWGRIGTFGGDCLELDCATEHLRSLRPKAKNVARIANRSLVCNVTEPGQKPKRKHKALERDQVWSSLRPGFEGWLSPEGLIIETARHDPFGPFVDNPELVASIRERLETAVAEDKVRQSCEFDMDSERSDPGGHIPWHHFSLLPYDPSGEELNEMVALVLGKGWGRLAVTAQAYVQLVAEDETCDALAAVLSELVRLTGMSVVAEYQSRNAMPLP